MLELLFAPIPFLLIAFELALVFTAFFSTISATVDQAITWYQWQSFLLTIVTGASALTQLLRQDEQTVFIAMLTIRIGLLPFMLALFIRPLLQRATLASEKAGSDRKAEFIVLLTPVFMRLRWFIAPLVGRQRLSALIDRYSAQKVDAESEWQRDKSLRNSSANLLLLVPLLIISFSIPYVITVPGFGESERIGLAISLALHFIGLFNMVIKPDIISQVLGLLIMDQGLYLAVVKIVEVPVPADLFVNSLYLYTLITIFLLVVLLPKVRAKTGSIDLDYIAEKSDLRSGSGG